MWKGELNAFYSEIGGTVDIAAMQIESESAVSQLHHAEGGPHGGMEVNKNFVAFLERLLGAAEVENFKVQSPVAYEELLQVIRSETFI